LQATTASEAETKTLSLTIHAGMPKTGTTALQLRLSASAGVLRNGGVDYPLQFRDKEGIAHHTLGNALSADDDLFEAVSNNFYVYVRANSAQQILISTESLTNAINSRLALRTMNFLSRIGSIRSVRLTIALRSIESFLESMYLHSVKVGEIKNSIDEYVSVRYRWSCSFFGAIVAIRAAAIVPTVRLVKFMPTPDFSDLMLNELRISRDLQRVMTPAQRVNERLSWKSQTILLHLDALQDKLGIKLDRQSLVRALSRDLSFEGDLISYSILSESQEGYLREGALAAAYDVGLREYPAYFGNQQRSNKPRIRLDLDALSDDDLARFRDWAEREGA
jgi:hypothetical protein